MRKVHAVPTDEIPDGFDNRVIIGKGFAHSHENDIADPLALRFATASLKDLILGALATGILLFGISFVYGTTGTTNLADIGTAFSGTTVSMPVGVQEVVTPDALAAGDFPR